MDRSLFAFIWRYSRAQQIKALLLTVVSFPFLYLSLDLPKTIVNKAINGEAGTHTLLGVEMGQISYLWALCGAFLALVFINGGFKYAINVYKGVLAERMLRRLRYMLVQRVLRFPLARFRTVSQGEIVAMVTAETEPLGGFFGDAFALPAFQGGILLTILVFMFVQDPVLGVAAIALYPLQAWLIPKMQRRVNLMNKERVRTVRKLSERLGETVQGVSDIHANNTSRYELADYANRMGIIFGIRFKIYKLKFFIKFLNNFLAQLTPFFFYAIGGYLVIQGDLSFGALVAILAAYKDLSAPWKEMLNWYQQLENARIKYEQVTEQFDAPGMMDEALMWSGDQDGAPLDGRLEATNVVLQEDEGERQVDGVTLAFDLTDHVALTGPGGGGKSDLARLLARQVLPSAGRISVGGRDLATLPESVTGRDIAYVDQESYLRAGTLRDALLYGLKHVPVAGDMELDSTDRREAEASGNSVDPIAADWVGERGEDGVALNDRLVAVLRLVGLEDDVFAMGLRQTVSADSAGELGGCLLEARDRMVARLQEEGVGDLVERFHPDRFNRNASVADNLLFGMAVHEDFFPDNLPCQPVMRAVLDETGLDETFLDIGRRTAVLMIDLFQDLPPGHEFFERYGFFDAEQLPEYQRILNASRNGTDALSSGDRERLRALPFRLVPARHRLGLIEDALEERILSARRLFAERMAATGNGGVAFFDEARLNPAQTVRENVLFGKVAADKAKAAERVDEMLAEVVDDLEMFSDIVALGLDSEIGIAGKRLGPAQRQQVVIARALLKQPRLMVVNEAIPALDSATATLVRDSVVSAQDGRGLVWVETRLETEAPFTQIFTMERGRLTSRPGGKAPAESGEAPDEAAAAPAAAEPPAATDGEDGQDSASGVAREARLLAGVPFFSGLDASTLKLLAFTSDRRTYAAGDTIMRQGEMAENAYVIMSGKVAVLVETEDGERQVAVRGPGDLVGELALLCEAPRTATLRAEEPAEALRISADVFAQVVGDNAQVATSLLRIIARRFEASMRELSGGKALYDPGTRLPNADMLRTHLRRALKKAEPAGGALCLVKLHGLQPVLETLGKGAEERLFKKVVRRLRQATHEMDTVARLSWSHFAVLAAGTTPDALEAAVHQSFAEPFRFGREVVNAEDLVTLETLALSSTVEEAVDVLSSPAADPGAAGE